MNKYHVHVYRVVEKYEVTLQAQTGVAAYKRALNLAKLASPRLKTVPVDIQFIAHAYDAPTKKHAGSGGVRACGR